MKITSSTFVKSSAKIQECPAGNIPEIAFIGRSNVGKSSLINMLTGRKSLAKTSVSPGKTRLINHFLINEAWYLVDLPGYGYAKVSKVQREKFGKPIESYLLKRENLQTVFALIDSRIKPQRIDLEFLIWLGEHRIPFIIIFTKTDKINKKELNRNIQAFFTGMSEHWSEFPGYILSSSVKKTGRDEILEFISEITEN